MNSIAAVLRELHRIHQQLADLRERLDRGPKQVKARSLNVARLEEELARQQEELKAAVVANDRKQLLLKTGEAKIADLKKKLLEASSNREYQALRDQIDADSMANSVFADEILEGMEKADEFQGRIVASQNNLEKARAELEKIRDQIRGQEETLLADLHRLEAELIKVEEGLPPDVREPYNRVVKSKGSDGMAAADGDNCSGCFHRLTPNVFETLRMGRVVICHSCGRLLYVPEDTRL
jgi:hypothetical protein